MTTYRERREARADRLRDWADKRETRGTAAVDRARELGSVIPFGQPILAGHYSEGRDRRYRDRIGATYDRGFADLNKADAMRSRADNIEAAAAHAIYSDDPDAVEALEAKLVKLEAQREHIKTTNAAYRKEHKAELAAALTAYGRDKALPFPGYTLTNLSGNISRTRQRLEQLRRKAAR